MREVISMLSLGHALPVWTCACALYLSMNSSVCVSPGLQTICMSIRRSTHLSIGNRATPAIILPPTLAFSRPSIRYLHNHPPMHQPVRPSLHPSLHSLVGMLSADDLAKIFYPTLQLAFRDILVFHAQFRCYAMGLISGR